MKCVQIVRRGLQVTVQQQQPSPEGCTSCPVRYTRVKVGGQRKEDVKSSSDFYSILRFEKKWPDLSSPPRVKKILKKLLL